MKSKQTFCKAICSASLLQALLMSSFTWGALPTEEWTARYSGSKLGSYDIAMDMAVDTFGNVYVTGYSYNSATGYDYATIKYDNTGNELWVQRYDAGEGDDYAVAIAIDDSGYVYVTGYSDNGYAIDNELSYYDYATIKATLIKS
jgi:hypothetical protein